MWEIDNLTVHEKKLLEYIWRRREEHGVYLIGNYRTFDCKHIADRTEMKPGEVLSAFFLLIQRGFFKYKHGSQPIKKDHFIHGAFLTMRMTTYKYEKKMAGQAGEFFDLNDMFVLIFIACTPKYLNFTDECLSEVGGMTGSSIAKSLTKLLQFNFIKKEDYEDRYESCWELEPEIEDTFIEKMKEVMDDEAIEKIRIFRERPKA